MNPTGEAQYLFDTAAGLERAQRWEEAAETYRRLIALLPQAIPPRVRLAAVLQHIGRRNEATAVLDEVISLDPYLRTVCRDPDAEMADSARAETVLANCRHILSRYPTYAPAHYGMACELVTLGKFEDACRAAERAITLNPTLPAYYHVLIYSGNEKQKAAALDALRQLHAQEEKLPQDGRAMLHFLLSKTYADAKRYDDAFAHLAKANSLKRALIAYDEAQSLREMRDLAAAFTAERITALQGRGHHDPRPVFVIGMLRSGTSLVEQIIAAHPKAHGAGEIPLLPDLVREKMPGVPAETGSLSPDGLCRLGQAYAERLGQIAPAAARIVDKLPLNFLYAGLIHLALPQAKIVHVMRDPLDTCFSCYQHTFAGNVGFAYDIGEMGRYYKAYQQLMAHWQKVLPSNVILNIQYEALVEDFEPQARRLVEFCGLDWDPRCLNFHESTRAVATASAVQVRRPLFKSSIGRAELFGDHLAPLREALA